MLYFYLKFPEEKVPQAQEYLGHFVPTLDLWCLITHNGVSLLLQYNAAAAGTLIHTSNKEVFHQWQ